MPNLKSFLSIENVIAAILIIIGVIWIVITLWRVWKINGINSWPKTNAVVVSSLLAPVGGGAGDTYVATNNLVVSTKSDAQYKPHILYKYIVNGKEYQSDKIMYLNGSTYSALEAKTTFGEFEPGSNISIYYNPSNPSESYIFNSTANWIGAVIGIILVAIGAYLLYRHKVKSSEFPGLTDVDEYMDKTRPTDSVYMRGY